MRFTLATLAFAAALSFGAAQTQANHRSPGCTDIADAEMQLTMLYGEKMVAEKNGKRLYVNEEAKTWTVISVDKDKDEACLVTNGDGPAPKDF